MRKEINLNTGEVKELDDRPPVSLTSEEIKKMLIAEIESSVTARYIRCAYLGDQFAIDKITEVESKIQALRT